MIKFSIVIVCLVCKFRKVGVVRFMMLFCLLVRLCSLMMVCWMMKLKVMVIIVRYGFFMCSVGKVSSMFSVFVIMVVSG